MNFNTDQIAKGVMTLISVCADLKPTEKALIVSDQKTRDIGNALVKQIHILGAQVEHCTIPVASMHGQEPPENIAHKMLGVDVIFGLTTMSMAHTKARFAASNGGVRYLSLPDYTWEVITSPALQVDFRAISKQANQLADVLTRGKHIHFTTQLGTNLHLSIEERKANPAPGWCYEPGVLASPPDAEVNVPPIEHLTNGVVVVDGSIPCRALGLLSSPIKLVIKNGSVVDISGTQADTLKEVFDRSNNPKTRIIGEFGIGLNPLAVLKGSMLEDEGCLGTVHLGIGSNKTIGGLNDVPFHLDHIVRAATVKVDDMIIIENGVINFDAVCPK